MLRKTLSLVLAWFLACLSVPAQGIGGKGGVGGKAGFAGGVVVASSITVVQHTYFTSAAAASISMTFGSNTTAGNSLFACAQSYGNTTTWSATDTSNTWASPISVNVPSSNGTTALLYTLNIAGGSDTVVLHSTANTWLQGVMFEVHGLSSNALDQNNTGTASSGTTVNTSNITTQFATELIVACGGDYPNMPLWTSNILTILDQSASGTTGGYGSVVDAWEGVTSIQTNLSNTFGGATSGDDLGAVIASFH